MITHLKVNIKDDLKRHELYKIAEDKNTVNLAWFKTPRQKKQEAIMNKIHYTLLNFSSKMFKILLVIWTILIIIWLLKNEVWAYNENLKEYLKQKCYTHKLAKEYSHWKYNWTNAERCYLIWTAQMYYETKLCTVWAGKLYNNCYWFRANWFMRFKTKQESIDWYVNRYYKYDRYKTISQIIYWWCYISPVDWRHKCFSWFTFSEKHKNNYYTYVKNYFHENFK